MIKNKFAWVIILLTLFVLLVLSGCSTSNPPVIGVTPENSSSNPVVSAPGDPVLTEGAALEPVQPEAASRRGPGNFDLAEPEVGLSGLGSYRQSLEIVTEGAGSNTTRLARTRINNPFSEITLMETIDQNGQPVSVTAGRLGEAYVLQTGEGTPCQVVVDSSYQQDFQMPEPASMLPLVFGAESAGQETVNGVAAERYDFDERALHRYGEGKASGQVWVAAEGGWVVKYALRFEAAAGVETWLYDLTEVNVLAEVALPEGCKSPISEVPVPPSAQNVVRRSSALSFTTPEPAEAISAFYDQALTAEGWQNLVVFPEKEGEVQRLYRLVAGELQTTVIITMLATDAGLEVEVQKLEKTVTPPPAP